MTVSILQGDALARLRGLPSDHFHCVVTSPPYWGLRDYGVDGQIGLEETPEVWLARLVEVFREVRRVLRPDGVCFVNIGDSYASAPNGRSAADTKAAGNDDRTFRDKPVGVPAGLKAKDLVGQPWMLAFALQADGWWLRGDYIWAKPNPMPESVRDRCTKAHEYVFHLSKRERYFWDTEAVREPHQEPWRSTGKLEQHGTKDVDGGANNGFGLAGLMPRQYNPAGRNLRSVWTIATDPLPSIIVDGEKLDHFASYPVELARRCILAGTSAKGCCPECGAPWARVVELTPEYAALLASGKAWRDNAGKPDEYTNRQPSTHPQNVPPKNVTTGWRPTCSCHYRHGEFIETAPCRVLDPFGGSGRTALAAEELGRDCTLIELNPASVRMAHAQIERAKARRFIGDAPGNGPADPRQGALL